MLYKRGNHWYHSHYPLSLFHKGELLTFEGTPDYLYAQRCAERIYKYNPNIKLIVLVRNPIERAFSAWAMFRNLYYENPDYLYQRSRTANEPVRVAFDNLLASKQFPGFDDVVKWEISHIENNSEQPEPSYIRRGLYAKQLQNYLSYFNKDQVNIIHSQDLRESTPNALSQLCDFLEIPKHDWSSEVLPQLHRGNYNDKYISDDMKFTLNQFYRQHNEGLYELIGRGFGWN
jgi:hypothetical protein